MNDLEKVKKEEEEIDFEQIQKQIAEERKEQIKNYVYDGYIQDIQWNTDTLKELSDVLLKQYDKVIVYDNSYTDYIQPITTTNTLKNIINALQEFYNKVIDQHKRSCFYIETVESVEHEDHIELIFGHGT